MKISEKSNPSTKTRNKNVHRPVVTTIRDDDLTDKREQVLFRQDGRGTQVRTIKVRTDNEAQVKNING